MSSSDDHIVLFRRAPVELNRRKLERFARLLCGEVASGCGFTCLLTGDSELRRLNRDFLGQDYPTDVLSFPVGQASRPVQHLGEIAISVSRARAQAKTLGHSIEDEIRILMLHGLLHLRGMDHETDQGQMQSTESRWRRHFALPRGLIERAQRVRVKTPAPSPQPLAPARNARPARGARQ